MVIAQIISTIIFLTMFVLLVTEKVPRHLVTIGGAVLTLILVFGFCMHDGGAIWNTLSLESFVTPQFWYHTGEVQPSVGINWETVLFIAGMMVMVEGMAESGFFRWLCISIARKVHFQPMPIFIIFMVLSALLSMFIDSITVIMFLAAVTAELARMMQISPVPMILTEIFCANLGGSATMCGDPPNIIIGTSLGYSFFDFLSHTGVMALLAMIVVLPYFYFCFRNQLVVSHTVDSMSYPNPQDAITDQKKFRTSCAIFGLAVVLLVTHAQTGLTVSTIGVLIAGLTVLLGGSRGLDLVKRIDYETLLFFIGLFVVVSGLESTGILSLISMGIERLSGGNSYIMIIIILWGSGIASAFIDNIPFAATMIPVIRTLAQTQGVDLQTLAWTLSMGTDIGGSATPIGASANVVGTSIAAKNGYPVSWATYCKVQAPATILVLLLCTGVIFVRYL